MTSPTPPRSIPSNQETPSELDRALKYETGYAGRSWFLKDMQDNQLGNQIASSIVTAYSDPTMEGYGSFSYDHEGTPARRAYILRDGVLEEFLNNRQTAAIMGVEPNGSARSTEAQLVPLIRMTNTIFARDNRTPRASSPTLKTAITSRDTGRRPSPNPERTSASRR